VTGIADGKLMVEKGALHIDQGFVVTSHASQGKTVDQVIVSVPVNSFSQANEAQFYVSMSRARAAMHLFTDSKVALREAVTKPSSRLSPWELIANSTERRKEKEVIAQIQSASKSLRGRGSTIYGSSPGKNYRAMNSHADKEIESLVAKIQSASRIARLKQSGQIQGLQRYCQMTKKLEPQVDHER
jgi:hypothetical protein